MSTTAGFHTPVIAFVDEEGNTGTEPPLQMVSDVPKSKAGVMFAFTVTVKMVVVAHNPAPGVKV